MNKNSCVENTNPCTGCGVCAAVCPVKAISLHLNEEGFYQAFLDEEKCIKCGKCQKVCSKYPGNFPQNKDFDSLPLYAAQLKDKEKLKQSSSGGVAAALVDWGLENGYKIAGVVYDEKAQKARTIIAENKQNAEAFKGSKYLQSYTVDAFEAILKDNNKYIVFGTPCQIAGLHLAASLQGKRENFILVDFFCHGVPSYLLWNSFLLSLQNPPQKVHFRSKKRGWHNFTMEIDGEVLEQKKNPFYTLFFGDLLLNTACYACPSRKSFAFADIRLGDFWGSTYDLRDDGISCFCPISPRAQSLLEDLEKVLTMKDGPHQVCRRIQAAFRDNDIDTIERVGLLQALENNNIELAIEIIKPIGKKRFFHLVKNALPDFLTKYIRYIFHKYKGI